MLARWGQVRLAARVARLVLSKGQADSEADYDQASGGYDAYFSRAMGAHALELLQSMAIAPGQDVLELACGTGHLTLEIARRLEGRGTVTAIDKSAGMLAVARRKLASADALTADLYQADMMDFLRQQPDGRFDAVICGWAICYAQPVDLLREVARVLRPAGQVGIIETRKDALEILQRAFERVLTQDPSLLRRYLRMALPANATTLRHWFTRAGLEPVSWGDGAHDLPCRNGEEALEWVQRSGAAAGFMDAFDRQREREILDRLRGAIDHLAAERHSFRLTHTFVTGVARRHAA